MKVGDVNGDGEITGTDEELLLEAIDYSIRNNGAVKNNKICSDLNHDGVTNLADLTFFTKGYLDTKDWNTVASLEKEISDEFKKAALENAEPVEGTKTNGVSLADLIKKPGEPTQDGNTAGEGTGNSEEPAKKLELRAFEIEQVPVLDDDGNQITDENGDPVYEAKEVEVGVSEEHPVGIEMDLGGATMKEVNFEANVAAGEIEIEVGENETIKVPIVDGNAAGADDDEINGTSPTESNVSLPTESKVKATVDENGNISLNLGNQIAVKKITLTIKAVKNTNLAQIGTVEFLNGMEERISEPEPDFPTNVKVEQDCSVRDKDARIVVTWDKVLNAGDRYEVEVSTSSSTKADGSFSSTIPGVQDRIAQGEEYSLKSEHGNFKLIKINTTYYVHVRCVSEDGSYKSKWSDYAKVTTVANSTPDKPDYVSAKGDFRSLKVSWGSDNTNSTTGYDVYYRNITQDPNGTYDKINVGKTTSCTITGLEDKQEYEVYVVGYNTYNGRSESPQSVHSQAKTTSVDPIQVPKYNAVNCDDEGNLGSAHIVSVTRNGGSWTV
ncbi:MAG: fibronectin type III domain-containing protein, partial [Oscillospiraceae bacterium]|nr:fibronectin type III domain-containing protein [Oscillospiraceae bacterium]